MEKQPRHTRPWTVSFLAGLALLSTEAAYAHPRSAGRAGSQEIAMLQQDLNADLAETGMPELAVDGLWGPQTARATCAERLLTGGTASLQRPTSQEVKELLVNDTLRSPDNVSGFIVSKVCQILAIGEKGSVADVMPASTGVKGYETPTVKTRVVYGRYGWHNSTKYPAEDGSNGNMYKTLYLGIGNGYAIHGSRAMSYRVTTRQSHGCIRVSLPDADKLWRYVGGPEKGRNDQYFNGKHFKNKVPVTILD